MQSLGSKAKDVYLIYCPLDKHDEHCLKVLTVFFFSYVQ